MAETIEIPDPPTAARTLTVFDVIRIVLPDGANGTKRWRDVCAWPPDLFATVASITERSGLYSQEIFTSYWIEGFTLKDEWMKRVREVGSAWAATGSPPAHVRQLWRELIGKYKDAPIDDPSAPALAWKKIVFDLLVIADEACAGIGFLPEDEGGENEKETASIVQFAVYKNYSAWMERSFINPDHVGGEILPHLPFSLCIHVPRGLLCVQPKATTPAVGCTLRSLTHNLA